MKCYKCGGKILAKVFIKEEFEFTLDDKGNLKELNCLFTDSIDEFIKLYMKENITMYYCEKCNNQSKDLKNLMEEK